MGNKEMMLSGLRKRWEQTPETIKREHGETRFNRLFRKVDDFLDLCNPDISPVVEDMLKAITSREPQFFYMEGPKDETFFISLLSSLPEELVDACLTSRIYNVSMKLKPFLRRTFNFNI